MSASDRVVRDAADADLHVGRPYQIAGQWFRPQDDPAYDKVGTASWYGPDFHGRRTASGEVYDMHALTAAHPTLPLPTYARVTNVDNGRSVVVRINDRGPFTRGRLIDVSKRVADTLEFRGNGTAQVRVQYVGAAPLETDDEWVTTTIRHDGAPLGTTMLASADEVPPATAEPAARPDAPEAAGRDLALASGGGAGERDAAAAADSVFPGQLQPTLAWVSGPGYAPVRDAGSAVADAFRLFAD